MPHCHPKNPYQNLFLTVPDRGFSKQDLLDLINAWRSDYTYCEVVREPYKTPKAGFSHHYHVGLCFMNRVRIQKLITACNRLKQFRGMDFRTPLVARGKSAVSIFSQYFRDPSKYKDLDEHPTLVRNRGPRPPVPSRFDPEWGIKILRCLQWQADRPLPPLPVRAALGGLIIENTARTVFGNSTHRLPKILRTD